MNVYEYIYIAGVPVAQLRASADALLLSLQTLALAPGADAWSPIHPESLTRTSEHPNTRTPETPET